MQSQYQQHQIALADTLETLEAEPLSPRRDELIERILVIDFNLQNHARIRAHGFRVTYGDIGNPEALRHHGIHRAKIILSTINNTYLRGISNEGLVDEIRHINPDARVIATADNDDAATELLNRGAFRAVSPPAHAAPAYARALLDALRAGGRES